MVGAESLKQGCGVGESPLWVCDVGLLGDQMVPRGDHVSPLGHMGLRFDRIFRYGGIGRHLDRIFRCGGASHHYDHILCFGDVRLRDVGQTAGMGHGGGQIYLVEDAVQPVSGTDRANVAGTDCPVAGVWDSKTLVDPAEDACGLYCVDHDLQSAE